MPERNLPRSQRLDQMMFWSMASIMGMVLLFLIIGLMNTAKLQGNQEELKRLAVENNVYHRANACIISVQPLKRTPDYVKRCYDNAEMRNNTKVERFGDAE